MHRPTYVAVANQCNLWQRDVGHCLVRMSDVVNSWNAAVKVDRPRLMKQDMDDHLSECTITDHVACLCSTPADCPLHQHLAPVTVCVVLR